MESDICAICKFNHLNQFGRTQCINPRQTDTTFKNYTKFNDSCPLFENRDESYYISGEAIPPIKSKTTPKSLPKSSERASGAIIVHHPTQPPKEE